MMRRPLRRLLPWCLTLALPLVSSVARADAEGPGALSPRGRPCCALAPDMPIHLGATHIPVVIAGVISAAGVGNHSYAKSGELTENSGFLYTRRGGFVDLGHTRDNADTAAYLAMHLRPLLARGAGTFDLGPKGAERIVRITRAVPAEDLERTSNLIGLRIGFHLSVWAELVQYYGLTKYRAAEEIYSSFTPDDLYSNLLGAHLGIAALESRLPYDRAMDVGLATVFDRLGAVSQAETRRTLDRLAGRWWSPDHAWPAPQIAIKRSYAAGPRIYPTLAPADVIASNGDPMPLDVPQTDEHGEPLASYYKLEIRPHLGEMVRFPREEQGKALGEEDIPRLIDEVRKVLDTGKVNDPNAPREAGVRGEVGHYVTSIRLVELSGMGGVRGTGDEPKGAGGGSLTIVRGDTRGGDFGVLRLDMLHAPARGLMAGAAFFQADALWFCHDPETRELRAPLVSLLGPCAPGEWLGIGGAIGEALHDGGTGRTALRPIRLAGVVNPLGNGQSASYDAARLLLHVGGEVEHIWSEGLGSRTIPRTGASLSFLLRTPARRVELRGAAGYRLHPGTPRDGVFESDLRLAYHFLVGAAPTDQARSGPWGFASVGLEGSYSYWARPENAYPEIAAPFVSTSSPGTWQALVTATLGLQKLAF
ncbi:DUF4056 domain-containing protein [Pendulispora albinea]|uniref:DUF4056 domain-containing protein n=1 Tax=Pendulispora albinea TaxID=2741071 RepID=A0ABZ2M490_9BACT